MKRNIKLLKAWVAALRSGKYHQAQMALCNVRGNQTFHCCLGVACRVMSKNGVKIDVGHNEFDELTFNGEANELTEELREKLGITAEEQQTLVGMNDDEGSSFRDIADFIEEDIINGT